MGSVRDLSGSVPSVHWRHRHRAGEAGIISMTLLEVFPVEAKADSCLSHTVPELSLVGRAGQGCVRWLNEMPSPKVRRKAGQERLSDHIIIHILMLSGPWLPICRVERILRPHHWENRTIQKHFVNMMLCLCQEDQNAQESPGTTGAQ